MHQPQSTEFEDALERYRRADKELLAAAKQLSDVIARDVRARDELKVALVLDAPDNALVRGGEIATIQKTVADFYGLPPSVMKSKDKPNHVAHPRQIAMVLATELTGSSMLAIGAAFGGRDHGTVMHAKKSVAARVDVDRRCAEDLAKLRMKLRLILEVPEAAHA